MTSETCARLEFVPLTQEEVDALVVPDLALGIGVVEVSSESAIVHVRLVKTEIRERRSFSC